MSRSLLSHLAFNHLVWFQTVAEERSFTKAAARLGVAQSTLSHAIRQLEITLGFRLLTRTTRNVAITATGERFLQILAPRLSEIESIVTTLRAADDKPIGTIKLTLSDHALKSVVWPKLKAVLQAYPEVKVEFSLDNGFCNIIEKGFDAGVRLGESLEKDMIAVRIGPDWRLIAVAAPSYLETHGRPEHPRELVRHSCLNMRHKTSGALYAWEFEKDGQALRIRVEGQLTFNDSYPMIDAAISGYGIAYVPEDLALEELRNGTLVQILDDWSPLFEGYHLYYPSARQNPPAFQLIVTALRAHKPWDEMPFTPEALSTPPRSGRS
ncbi:LysR family transcriptional regulator [Oecophyllibacter saccharovorans]|uniref:LysR family transcriptional regulator n=1 Tax=Oecophyllibacter saccharovorans TaxID=2558360 RepID=UPI001142C307|nr:LysR family transcriptional regulator [Oecophyllibacter saccharovorans]QDH14701.1 LysR family transcriptional regulator [Oecophyllibacter saccharovorans]